MKKMVIFVVLLMPAGLCEIASAADVELAFILPAVLISPGQPFHVELSIDNDGPDYAGAQLFVALTVGTGDYWFYPSWVKYPDEIDFEVMDVSAGSFEKKEIIPEFDWPYGVGDFSGALFLAAMMHEGRLISNVAEVRFGWTELIYMSTGMFKMGSPSNESCRFSDETLHDVYLTLPFYIQDTEVTQAEWEMVFGSNPSHFSGSAKPVEQVTWFDACVYCNRMSAAVGLKPCYYSDPDFNTVFDGNPPIYEGTVYWDRNAGGFRLPTEAEWEYACRAGSTTPYYNDTQNNGCEEDSALDSLAWYSYNSGGETHDAGRKTANTWGLYDMLGNVWEWCWDWYGQYPDHSDMNPAGPDTGTQKVIRGGAFNIDAESCRCADRGVSWPGTRTEYIGFRMVRNGS